MKARPHYLVLVVAIGLAGSTLAIAQLPTGPQVAAGQVSIAQTPGAMTLTQTSPNAIVNWQSFNVGTAAQLRLVQPDASAAMLARVTGGTPSSLQGALKADGNLFLVNPQGIVIGRDAVIDTAGFIASTHDVSDADFLRGTDLTFKSDSSASIVNLGTITARQGNVFLLAQSVKNDGAIAAPNGTAGLGAGMEFHLASADAPSFEVKLNLGAAMEKIGVDNSGAIAAAQAQLEAAGGSIYALAVNQSGVVRATGVANINGRVLLTANAGDVNVSGEISAHNADGSGGQILIGGGFQGKNADVANAAHTTVSASAKLDTSATSATGNGGEIVVWASDTTSFAGSIAARGGSAGGDGGQLEVSGQHLLDFTGAADTSAARGKRGSLLLDPDGVIISTAADQDIAQQGGFVQGLAAPSFLNNGTLNALLATTDVEVQAGDGGTIPAGFFGISVNADLGWTGASTLTLVSGDTIAINANINAGSTGNLMLKPGTVSAGDSTTGTVTLASNKGITVNTLSIEKSQTASSGGANIGAVNLAGTITASTVELVRNSGGVTGDVLINNPANQIGTLRGTGAAAAITGNLRVTDSAAGLMVDGDLSAVSGAIEIVTTGNLTVNSGALVKNTGASDLVLAANSGSFVNNAGASAIDASGAGRYLIYSDSPAHTTKGGLTGLSAYSLTYGANAPASITQAGDRFLFSLAPTLTFTADNLSKSAGAANPPLTYTITGLQTGDTLADAITGTPALATTATTGSPGGSYPISIANGSLALTNMGYGLSLQAGALSVIANLLTISANSTSKTYGAANPTFTASYAGFTGGDTAAIVTGLQFSTTATTSSGVGSYAITPFGATAGSYTINFVPGTLTINQASLTIRPTDVARTYGAANPSFSADVTGFVNGDTSSVVSGLSLGTSATTGSNAGTYAITGSGATAANYAISYTPGTLTVNKAPLTVSVDNASKTYGAANPVFTASYSGLVNGDTAAAVSGLSLGTSATTGSGVGSYPITASGATATNYAVTTQAGTLSVNPAILTVAANSANRTYSDANPGFDGTITGFVLGENSSVLTTSPTYASSASPTSNVGSYAIGASGAVAANYNFNYVPGTLTINPAVLSVRADNLTRSYGDANPTLTYSVSGLKNGDSADGKFSIFTNGTTATANSPVGNYNILLTGNDTPNDNYTTFFANGTLTVQPRPLTITADAVSRQYGLANPTFTAKVTGLASFDSASAISNLRFTSTATAATGVGTSLVFPSADANPNYAITFLPGQLTITPAPLSVLAGGDVTRTYGDANPVFTPFITAGTLYNSDTAASIGLSTSTAATPASSVGKYAVTPTLTSPNYTLTPIAGSITILPALLNVGVANATRVYGDANPTFTAAIVGGAGALRNGDTAASIGLTGTTTATPASPVGFFPLSASIASPNYQLNLTAGSLNITPASLNVTVGNGTRVYGDANPTVAFSATGLKNSDTAASVLALVTTATPASSIGSYSLSATSATPNYTLSSVTPGTLQITPRPVSITFNDASRVFGGTDPLFSFQIGGRGFAASDPVASILGGNPGTTTATTLSNVGTYPIALSAITNPNYAFTVQPGTLTITPRSVSITADSFAISGGDVQPAFTAQVAGLPGGVTTAQAFPNLAFTTQPFTSAVTLSSGVTLSPEISLDPNTTVVSSLINVAGYASSPNYTVMQVTPGVLTTTTKSAATELTLSTSSAATTAAAEPTKLTVGTGDSDLHLTTPFRGTAVQPYLQQAATALMQQLLSSGDTATIDKYFKDGIDGFLAGLDSDPTKQAMLTSTLSDVILKYAKLPPDQQPPALAGLIKAATENAKQVKIDEAKQVVQLYDNWLKPPTTLQPVNTADLHLVPDFAKEVRNSFAKDAAIVVGSSLGAGVTTAAVMAGLPTVFFTSAQGVEAGALLASTSAETGAGLGTIVAPAMVAIGATAVVAVAAIQLSKQPAVKAAIADDQVLAVAPRSQVTLNLDDPNDQAAFSNAFINLMLGAGGSY